MNPVTGIVVLRDRVYVFAKDRHIVLPLLTALALFAGGFSDGVW